MWLIFDKFLYFGCATKNGAFNAPFLLIRSKVF